MKHCLTVGDLKTLLSNYPENMRVLIRSLGYETGFSPLTETVMKVVTYKSGWYPTYAPVDSPAFKDFAPPVSKEVLVFTSSEQEDIEDFLASGEITYRG